MLKVTQLLRDKAWIPTRSEWLQLHALDLAALSWEEVRPGEAREKQGQKNPWTFLSVLSSDRGERGEPERSQSHARLDAGALPPGHVVQYKYGAPDLLERGHTCHFILRNRATVLSLKGDRGVSGKGLSYSDGSGWGFLMLFGP